MTRLKYDYDMLKNICDENGVTLLEDYKDKYITRDTRIIGKCILCENSFDKSLNKLHKQQNFGCIKCAKDFKFDKIKKTMTEKYGVEYAAQSDIFKDKMKEACLKKYGVNYGFQSDEVKEKIKKTNNERYGCDYGLQCDFVKEKKRNSYLKKYGVDNPLKCNEIKEKSKKTCLEKYGVEYPCQNKEIHEKQNKNSYYLKNYVFPSGKFVKIQGYENYALNDLINKYNIDENDIIIGSKNVPEIWYTDSNEKKHRHFVDIYLPKINKCIEIKSKWTFNIQKNTVFLKQKSAKELNYLYEIWVYDNKGNKVDFNV